MHEITEPGSGPREPTGARATERATLGGGCFWCLEAVFERLRGVEQVVSGYAGGMRPNPTYAEVCSGATGHAEVVQIIFDPTTITFRELLDVFFAIHDPTTVDRQGNDVGTQYRSIVFAHSPDQARVAREVIAEFERDATWDAPIVTRIEDLRAFYPAEKYHQHYFERNGTQSYCQLVVEPKVAKARQRFASKLRD